MNPDETKNYTIESPHTPLKKQLSQEAREFLVALSPQKPILIKKNAQTFLEQFHQSASKLIENMKTKYINDLKNKVFNEGVEQRLSEFNSRLLEAQKLIKDKIDVRLGTEIMSISLNWLHPVHFKLEDGKLSNLYEQALDLTCEGLELLSLGYYKQKNYRSCIKYSRIFLNFRPNNVSVLRQLFSAYTHDGNNIAAQDVLSRAKKILTIQDFRKISEEFYSQNAKKNGIWKFFSRHSATVMLFSGVISYIFTRFFMRFPEKESIFLGIGTGVVSYLTTLWFYSRPCSTL